MLIIVDSLRLSRSVTLSRVVEAFVSDFIMIIFVCFFSLDFVRSTIAWPGLDFRVRREHSATRRSLFADVW